MVPPSLHPLFPMDPACQCLGSVFLGGISLNTSGIPACLVWDWVKEFVDQGAGVGLFDMREISGNTGSFEDSRLRRAPLLLSIPFFSRKLSFVGVDHAGRL